MNLCPVRWNPNPTFFATPDFYNTLCQNRIPRSTVKKEKDSVRVETRSVRAKPASKPTTRSDGSLKKTAKKKATPKARFKKGDKVRVQYPDAIYEGDVSSSTTKRTMVYFPSDKTQDELLPSEYNTIEIIKKA